MRIDQIYPSMQGPFEILDVDFSQLDWVTSMRTEVVDAETNEVMGGEFFCHSQLGVPQVNHRFFVAATGMAEIRFPPGFAINVGKTVRDLNAKLGFLGMVLNNHVADIDRQAFIRTTFEYFRSKDLARSSPLTELRNQTLTMHVEDLENYEPQDGQATDVSTHCALVEQPDGVERSIHWWVPPGYQITRFQYPSGVTPRDGTVHFATAHLHNYGVYMRLIDVTSDKILWQSDVQNEPDRDQIEHISVYSSATGFRVYKDHTYEIEALYNNTTDRDVDAMAMMNIYFADAAAISKK